MSNGVVDDTVQSPCTLWGNVAIDLINPRQLRPFPTATLPVVFKKVVPQLYTQRHTPAPYMAAYQCVVQISTRLRQSDGRADLLP